MRARAAVLRLTAFAATPDGGNPAGVVLDAALLGDDAMQAIAAEVGYAETAFVVDPVIDGDPRRVRVRYFSPTVEVPFCGHATIATSIALAERRGTGPFVIETPVGEIRIGTESTADGQLSASFTSVEPVVGDEVTDALLALLGLSRDDLDRRWPPAESFAGNWHPVLALKSQAVFDTFEFDPVAMRALMDERGWHGTVTIVCSQPVTTEPAIGWDADVMVEARNLFPVGVMTEDPATGSAAASLGAYLRAIGAVTPPARVVVHQGRHIGRPSVLVVDVPVHGGIRVSGTAVVIPDVAGTG